MLHKEENKRITADNIMAHDWITKGGKDTTTDDITHLSSDDTTRRSRGETELEGSNNPNIRQDGPNCGVAERRRELMERLQEKDKGKEKQQKDGKKKPEHHYWAKWFTIIDKHMPGTTLKFEWWDKEKVAQERILNMEGVKCPPVTKGMLEDRSPNVVGKMLKEHNIDITAFGVGQAKTLDQLAAEVQSGAARLMLDATEHKKLVRVVDVVLLRIYATDKKGKILIETGEQFPDHRKRQIARLPGTKKEPHENSKETAQRIVKELLNMGEVQIQFDFDEKDVFEEEDDSPSFPGVRTVYRKEIVEAYVNEKTTDQKVLANIGLSGTSAEWSAQDARKNTKYFEWMTEKKAQSKQVKLMPEGSGEVSGLVMAPIGLNEEDLRKHLNANDIDVSLYGQDHAKSLKEFSNELMKGESSLTQDVDGKLLRVVDVVVLQIINPAANDILVQTEQTFPDGTKNTLNRLPGAKRRPDENQFLTARRVLRKQLKIDENMVKLDAKDVQYYEEEKTSPAFPGLKTVYRKRLIRAELLRNEGR